MCLHGQQDTDLSQTFNIKEQKGVFLSFITDVESLVEPWTASNYIDQYIKVNLDNLIANPWKIQFDNEAAEHTSTI